jgi:hypothetical protein
MQLECISLNQKQPVDHVSGKNIYALESYEGYCHLLSRVMFIKSHRYHHRKCSYLVPGLMVSKSNVFLGASLDGVVKCSICGEFYLHGRLVND